MHVAVDGLLAYADALLAQQADNLGRGPVLVLYHPVDAPPQLVRLAVVVRHTVLTRIGPAMGSDPHILAVGVALYLADHSGGADANLTRGFTRALFSFPRYISYPCSRVSCLYIAIQI